MAGPASAVDDAMAQALQAQLAPHAYLDGWRCRYAPAADANALLSSAQQDTLGMTPMAAAGRERRRHQASPTAAGASRVRRLRRARHGRRLYRRALTLEQREVGRLKALRTTAERKEIRARLRSGEITLAQALARDDEAAGRMRAETLLRALPGVGAATARRLMAAAGVDGGRRVALLTAGQKTRLLAAAATVNSELTARRDRRHHSGH